MWINHFIHSFHILMFIFFPFLHFSLNSIDTIFILFVHEIIWYFCAEITTYRKILKWYELKISTLNLRHGKDVEILWLNLFYFIFFIAKYFWKLFCLCSFVLKKNNQFFLIYIRPKKITQLPCVTRYTSLICQKFKSDTSQQIIKEGNIKRQSMTPFG